MAGSSTSTIRAATSWRFARSRRAPEGRAASPRIDVASLLAVALWRLRCRVERADHPAPRVGRVDHVVDSERCASDQRLAALIRGVDQLVVATLACGRVVDQLELVAKAELHLTL